MISEQVLERAGAGKCVVFQTNPHAEWYSGIVIEVGERGNKYIVVAPTDKRLNGDTVKLNGNSSLAYLVHQVDLKCSCPSPNLTEKLEVQRPEGVRLRDIEGVLGQWNDVAENYSRPQADSSL